MQAVILALVQGLTEFLPISSSGHLILFPALLGWPDQGQAFDVALHVGSLTAVIIYFKKDVASLFAAIPAVASGQRNSDTRLFLNLLIATVPALVVAFFLKSWIELNLRGALVIASASIIFGFLLWHGDRQNQSGRELDTMGSSQALIIGLSQILALLPGTSRSGITMTAARYLGFGREQAARFSFLMSIPIITAAGVIKTVDLILASNPDDLEIQWSMFALGMVVSGFAAYLCIVFFLKTIQRIGMLPFVIYRIVLGLVIFYIFW